MISIWEEHLFWLEILQDHSYFVRDHLSPCETEYVHTAQQYIHGFGELLTILSIIPRTAGPLDESMVNFANRVWPTAKGYFEFEGKLQSLRIDNKVNLNLSPTYLNGTLSENQEYLRILTLLVQGQEPAPLPLEVGRTTLEMNQFIYGMVIKYRENKVLNKTTLRFLEHHFPETCYFIKKLSYYAPGLQKEASSCSLRRPSYL